MNANGSINNWSKHGEIIPHIRVHRPILAALKTHNHNGMPISIKPRLLSNVGKHTQNPCSISGLRLCLPKDDQLSTKHVKHISENFLIVGTPNTVPCEDLDYKRTFDNDNINQHYSVAPTRLVGGGHPKIGKEFQSKVNIEKLR